MQTDFERCIIEMLHGCPNGLTAMEIGQRLGVTAGSISSRLSKMAAYGIIGRARAAPIGHGSRGNVYQAPRGTDRRWKEAPVRGDIGASIGRNAQSYDPTASDL
jgi:hypothetical protein